MRVLWIASGCSLQDEPDNPGLTGRTEPLMTRYCACRIQLAVAYRADGAHERRLVRDGITYYAVDADLGVGLSDEGWEKAKKALLAVAEEYRPDIIQCFGAEWPYGAIAGNVDVPVVIHMMGFLNVYFLSLRMVRRDGERSTMAQRLRARLRELLRRSDPQESPEGWCMRWERQVMSTNRYFFGRTRWDRDIVRHYAPGARYYHVPEAIKPGIWEAAGRWRYHGGGRLRLFSLSSADDRKGNEIILLASRILKEDLHVDVEWRVAGHMEFFPRFEKRTGIRHEDVGVELLGMISCGQIVRELTNADLFIHPSIMDNSPHAVCEAQLVGCPVIASNVGGVPDLVEDGVTGFLYPYNEPHTLAFRIADLYRDEPLLTRISEAAVQTARARHDPEQIAHAMLCAYESILEDYQK